MTGPVTTVLIIMGLIILAMVFAGKLNFFVALFTVLFGVLVGSVTGNLDNWVNEVWAAFAGGPSVFSRKG